MESLAMVQKCLRGNVTHSNVHNKYLATIHDMVQHMDFFRQYIHGKTDENHVLFSKSTIYLTITDYHPHFKGINKGDIVLWKLTKNGAMGTCMLVFEMNVGS